jgi:hypothetical protein
LDRTGLLPAQRQDGREAGDRRDHVGIRELTFQD